MTFSPSLNFIGNAFCKKLYPKTFIARLISALPFILSVFTISNAQAQTNGPSWQAGDSAQSYVARIRAEARTFGGACETEQHAMQLIGQNTKFTIDPGKGEAGSNIKIHWSTPDLSPVQQMPLYLMVSANRPIRFDGKGFYALNAGAINPFGIEHYANQDRAIVALYGVDKIEKGIIEIEPLIAGATTIEAAIIGYLRACERSIVTALGKHETNIKPASKPSIVINQQFSSNASARYAISPNRSRIIKQSGTNIQLLDAQLRDIILHTNGEKTSFSSTGRFLLVQQSKTDRIYDTIDGELVFQVPPSFATSDWELFDSFFSIFFGLDPLSYSINLLKRNNLFSETRRDLRFDKLAPHRFDLENDMIIAGQSWRTNLSGKEDKKPVNHRIDENELKASITTRAHYTRTDPRFLNYPATTKRQTFIQPTQWFKQSELAANTIIAAKNLESRTNWKTRSINNQISNNKGFWKTLSEMGVRATRPHSPDYSWYPKPDGTGFNRNIPWSNIQSTIERDIPGSASHIPSIVTKDSLEVGCSIFRGKFHRAHRFVIDGRVVWPAHFYCSEGTGFFDFSFSTIFDSKSPDKFHIPTLKAGTDGARVNGTLASSDFNLTMLSRSHVLYTSKERSSLVIYDLDRRESIFASGELPGGAGLLDVRTTPDQKHIVQLNSDGTFYVHHLEREEIVLSGRYIDDEIILWTPDFRFDSTAEGGHYVNLQFPGYSGQYSFQQFDQKLKVPKLAAKVLAGEHKIDEVNVPVPPRLFGSLTPKPDGSVVGTISAEAINGLKKIQLFEDGILTGEWKTIKASTPTSITFKRRPGTRWVNMVAVDQNNLLSQPLTQDLGGFVGHLPKLHVMAVGIDHYSEPRLSQLDFAASDARRLIASMEKNHNKAVTIASKALLQNEEATPEQILLNVQKTIEQMSSGDTAVFHFAGHGLQGKDDKFYIATSETDLSDIENTSVPWSKISALLSRARGKVVVLLDACRSGAAGTEFFSTNDQIVGGILERIPTGLTILSASKGREDSIEYGPNGGGLFTAGLAHVIAESRGQYDTNRNGTIEISELFQGVKSYVQQAVLKLPDGGNLLTQTPWLARNQMIGDYALF